MTGRAGNFNQYNKLSREIEFHYWLLVLNESSREKLYPFIGIRWSQFRRKAHKSEALGMAYSGHVIHSSRGSSRIILLRAHWNSNLHSVRAFHSASAFQYFACQKAWYFTVHVRIFFALPSLAGWKFIVNNLFDSSTRSGIECAAKTFDSNGWEIFALSTCDY